MFLRIAAAAGLLASAMALAAPAHALTMKECSAKYQDAKKAGTLKGMKWNDFRKSQCGTDASAMKPSGKDTSEPTMANTKNAREPSAPTTKAPRGVVFPSSVDKKFAKESPGKARMHTCLEQYHANKAKHALGGLKWIQKGGGYYSICNARLKKG